MTTSHPAAPRGLSPFDPGRPVMTPSSGGAVEALVASDPVDAPKQAVALLLLRLARAGLRLFVKDGKLAASPRELLTPAIREDLRALKGPMLDAFATPEATARDIWTSILEEVAQLWQKHAAQTRAAGWHPAWLDDARDLALQAEVGAAIRAGDLDAALAAINAWRRAWLEVIEAQPAGPAEDPAWIEIDSSVLGEHVLVALRPEGGKEAQANRPGLVVYSSEEVERLHAAQDPQLLRASHAAKKALGARALDPRLADRVIDESAGHRPPPNPGVIAMLERGHGRFGFRAQAERSLTDWLRRHRPEVAQLWPEAPLDASWLDWRQRLGPEHVPTLDAAFEAMTRPEASKAANSGADTRRRPAAERRRP